MQFLLQEKVYKAHYRSEMEPIDCIVKDMARLCVDTCNASNPSTLMATMQPLHDRFWLKFPRAAKILREWLRVAKDAYQVHVSLSVNELQEQIWKSFLHRLSLDIWLLTDDKSHGNEMLRVICDVTQDTLYGTFPMLNSLAGLPQCKPREVRPALPRTTDEISNPPYRHSDEIVSRHGTPREYPGPTSPQSGRGGLRIDLTPPDEENEEHASDTHDVAHDLAYSDSDDEFQN